MVSATTSFAYHLIFLTLYSALEPLGKCILNVTFGASMDKYIYMYIGNIFEALTKVQNENTCLVAFSFFVTWRNELYNCSSEFRDNVQWIQWTDYCSVCSYSQFSSIFVHQKYRFFFYLMDDQIRDIQTCTNASNSLFKCFQCRVIVQTIYNIYSLLSLDISLWQMIWLSINGVCGAYIRKFWTKIEMNLSTLCRYLSKFGKYSIFSQMWSLNVQKLEEKSRESGYWYIDFRSPNVYNIYIYILPSSNRIET